MRIRIDPHTMERARERGVTLSQIEDVVRTGVLAEATGATSRRLAKVKIYDYHGTWKGRQYAQQMVKVIYVLEERSGGYGDGSRLLRPMAGGSMKITYHQTTDLLYIRLDETPQEVTNQELGPDVILDLGADDRIVGIEILDASRRLRLDQLLPVAYEQTA